MEVVRDGSGSDAERRRERLVESERLAVSLDLQLVLADVGRDKLGHFRPRRRRSGLEAHEESDRIAQRHGLLQTHGRVAPRRRRWRTAASAALAR
eukprot:2790173-Pleurochrysis_carterae.AAC.1